MINISNITNNVDNKQAFKLIGFIFGGIFGAFFSIICIFSTIDHIVYSTAYTQHDGIIIETDEVESYTSTTTRYKKVGGRRRKVTKTTTRHRQDVVVEYDNEIVEIEDVSVDANGYSVNDEVSIYVNKKNPEKVKIPYLNYHQVSKEITNEYHHPKLEHYHFCSVKDLFLH